ncbi:MAG TPA: 2-C-methyl-D-erythritol 4-phosphate cytidylyltransferase [Acidiferrobacter sp.]|nr:2-C-methyl-D-erythritol 4-phosphate cytidylyltransferase [Acidiferrobacter sp.]
MRAWVIVPAAGHGSRFGSALPKQYLPLAGATVLAQTLDRLDGLGCLAIAVGLAPGDPYWPQHTFALTTPLVTFAGGAERVLTVLKGLAALSAQARPDDLVFVHDAARPCVRLADLKRLADAARLSPDGALLARAVADTVKREGPEGYVDTTVDRRGLWLAQTPQVFPYARLRAALEAAVAAGDVVTDEAAAIERLGGRPRLIPGSPDNIKITLPEDLSLAEMYLAYQKRHEGMSCG